MSSHLRLWFLLVLLVGLIFAALVFAELQRDWSHAPGVKPVTLMILPADTLPLDSVDVTAADRSGGTVALPLVKDRWVAEEMFVTGLRVLLPRGAERRLEAVIVTDGASCFRFSAAQLRAQWAVSTPDSAHVAYESPRSLALERSRIPGLQQVINWEGDAAVLSRAVTSSLWKTALCLLFLAVALVLVPFGRPVESEAGGRSRTGRILLLCGAFAVFYGLLFFSFARFEDTADPRGDAWEYQAMAVGLVQGQGLNRVGGLEPFEIYRFKNAANDSTDYQAQLRWWGGRFHHYRTPGYPAFLAGVYKVFGISPLRAKQVQLALLILVAAFLPFIGFAYWRSIGFYAGVIGGMIFFDSWYGIASRLYTECLVIFALFLFVLVFYLYERKKTLPRVLLLGFLCGLALLVKGDLIFLPPLVLLYLAYQVWKKTIPVRQTIAFTLVCVVTIAPWSIYATRMSGQMVILSTQGSAVLLEGNNEKVLADGAWHAEYIADPEAFYNREEIRQLSVPQRVLRFYLAHPGMIPRLVSAKLTMAFGRFPYLRIAVFFILLRLFAMASTAEPQPGSRVRKAGKGLVLRYGGAAVALVAALVSVPLMFLILAGALLYAGRRQLFRRFTFPVSFVILLVNFVLVTIVVFGDKRFISVIDCFMILTAMRFLLSSLVLWLAPRELLLAPHPPASIPLYQG